VGVVLVAFALVWLLAIFPAMAKLPEDHHRVVTFEGTYQVMNAETQALDSIPVFVERNQMGKTVEDNVLTIIQIITCTHAQAGMELPQFGVVEVLGVDRSTREYVPGYGDMERSGQFCFPSDVQKESYSVWILSAGRPLEAKFIGEEEFHGLKVYDFEINEQNLPLGTQEGTGLPQVMDIVTKMKVEPVSGTTVDTSSDTTYSVDVQGMKMPYYISSIAFTEDTIDELVDTASDARSMITWATVYGFWIAIGVGAVLIVTGVVMFARKK
jgi:hypothetical protein